MTDVFLSYSRNDQQLAKAVVNALEAEGFGVFWDTTVGPGEQWRDVIGDALDSAGCVLVLWSDESGKSHWVREEAERARKRGVLLPFRVGEAEPPLGFGEYQAVRLKFQNGSLTRKSKATVVSGVHSCIDREPPAAVAGAAVLGRPKRGHRRFFMLIGLAATVAAVALVAAWTLDSQDSASAALDAVQEPKMSDGPSQSRQSANHTVPDSSQLAESDQPAAAEAIRLDTNEPMPAPNSGVGAKSIEQPEVEELDLANEGQCSEENPPIRCLFSAT